MKQLTDEELKCLAAIIDKSGVVIGRATSLLCSLCDHVQFTREEMEMVNQLMTDMNTLRYYYRKAENHDFPSC